MPGHAGRPPRTRSRLQRTSAAPTPARWGWHQLDSRWAARLVAAAGVQPGELVLDLGAGTGAITRALVTAGARVVAVELHPRRAATLRERFADDPVRVVRADVGDLRLPQQPFAVVANPPFAALTSVLRRLTSSTSRLDRAALVLPAWATARWAAGRGAGGRSTAGRFAFSAGLWVPPRAFRPPPPAPVRVLIVHRRR